MASAEHPPTSARVTAAHLTLLMLLTARAYYAVFGHDFVHLDDVHYITDNPLTLAGLSWSSMWRQLTSFQHCNWHPLTMWTHSLCVSLFGVNAAGHHALNIIIHGANCLVLYGWLRTVTGRAWASFAVAAMLAVHPAHVESVAWVSQRKDVLSLFFGLLTLWAYCLYARKPHWLRYLLVFVVCCLALMSKSMMVTLPCVMMLLDIWPLQRLRLNPWPRLTDVGRLVIEKLPLFIPVAGACYLTILAQEQAMNEGVTLPSRLANAVVAYANYVGMAIWPGELQPIYQLRDSLPAGSVISAAAVLVVISAFAWWTRHKNPVIGVGWLWFLGTLVPVIGLIQVGGQAMACRYAYFTFIGLYMAIAFTVDRRLQDENARPFAPAVVGGFIGILLIFAWHAAAQSHHWRNSLSLFARAVQLAPESSLARAGLGRAMMEDDQREAAMEQFAVALDLDPSNPFAATNQASLLNDFERPQEAMRVLQPALSVYPQNASLWANLGLALQQLGQIERAIEANRRALELDPRHASAAANLASIHTQGGEPEKAVAVLQPALAARPQHPELWNNLGAARFALGQVAEARTAFLTALANKPDYVVAAQNLASLFIRGKMPEEALPWLERAVALPDAGPGIAAQLARLYDQLDRPRDASRTLAQAAERHPNHAPTHLSLGVRYAKQGRLDLAIPRFERALALDPSSQDAAHNLARARRLLNESQ